MSAPSTTITKDPQITLSIESSLCAARHTWVDSIASSLVPLAPSGRVVVHVRAARAHLVQVPAAVAERGVELHRARALNEDADHVAVAVVEDRVGGDHAVLPRDNPGAPKSGVRGVLVDDVLGDRAAFADYD